MTTFHCGTCGAVHEGPPFSYAVDAPYYWTTIPEEARGRHGTLSGELCVIDEDRFIRGLIVIPVHDALDTFEWGVWVSLSRASFDRSLELWETAGRENEPPYFGYLSTRLPLYPDTLELKTHVHTRPVGERPLIELEPTDHPLAVEQREGIAVARVQEIAEMLLHQNLL